MDSDEIDLAQNVYLIPQINVQYTAFIMAPWVYNPVANLPTRVFVGDDRTDFLDNAIFDRNSNAYRARIRFSVIPTQMQDADGLADNSLTSSTGWTYEYVEQDAVDPVTNNLLPNAVPIASAHSSTQNMTVIAETRPNPYTAVIKIDSAVNNELIVPEFLSPDIDFHVLLTLDFSNPLAPKYSLSGWYNGFPCTELYIGNYLALQFDTHASGTNPFNLIGSGGQTVYDIDRSLPSGI